MVASFADAFTSVSVLAEPALPGDVTAAESTAYCAAKLLLCVSSFCPEVDHFVFSFRHAEIVSASGRFQNLSCAGGRPSFE